MRGMTLRVALALHRQSGFFDPAAGGYILAWMNSFADVMEALGITIAGLRNTSGLFDHRRPSLSPATVASVYSCELLRGLCVRASPICRAACQRCRCHSWTGLGILLPAPLSVATSSGIPSDSIRRCAPQRTKSQSASCHSRAIRLALDQLLHRSVNHVSMLPPLAGA